MKRRGFLASVVGLFGGFAVLARFSSQIQAKVSKGEILKIEPMTVNEVRAFRRKWEHLDGINSYGTPLILPPGCKVTPLNTAPREMRYLL